MVFKRLLGSLGVGGPTVDTVLDSGTPVPGGSLTGQVHLKGGNADTTIERIALELVAQVEAEADGEEHEGAVTFERFPVSGGFRLTAGQQLDLPFRVALPWETPVTTLHGQSLGIVLGVRTELAVSGAKDRGDLDPLAVGPLPAQQAILEALGRLGFGFASADLEYGRIGGTGQRLPFYQEIELTPAPQYAYAMQELEVTFLAHPGGMEVVLEADKPAGLFSSGHEALTRFEVSHRESSGRDLTAEVDGWIRQLVASLGTRTGRTAYASADSVDGRPHGVVHQGYGERRTGPGAGTAVAAGAAGLAVGVAGGLVAAEVIDEVGDFFEGDGESSEEG
ncbi:sporulation protein [Streptomyces sp. NPDC005963]|uniref:sporulation protein n=1 Tax=Streptomyces sp. NPDC005963 TaxID=3156721 RepID=UPI0033EBA47C